MLKGRKAGWSCMESMTVITVVVIIIISIIFYSVLTMRQGLHYAIEAHDLP